MQAIIEAMPLPTITDIETLHRKYAPSGEMLEWVFGHCQAVWDIAEQLIDEKSIEVDRGLVQVGCLLHDIGVYRLFDKPGALKTGVAYIAHGIEGREILQQEGLDEAVQRFASHHTGVGITKDEVETLRLPLPPEEYVAVTTEERLVMYADKFHSKEVPPCFNSYEWYKKFVVRYGEEKVARFVELGDEFGIPDLAPLAARYSQTIR
jgi:uncharacterized protein